MSYVVAFIAMSQNETGESLALFLRLQYCTGFREMVRRREAVAMVGSSGGTRLSFEVAGRRGVLSPLGGAHVVHLCLQRCAKMSLQAHSAPCWPGGGNVFFKWGRRFGAV